MKIDDDEPLVRIERGVCKVIDKNSKFKELLETLEKLHNYFCDGISDIPG